MMLRAMTVAALFGLAAPAAVTKTWVEGEMGYRVTVVAEGSAAARHGVRAGDVLAEPRPLPDRLRGSGADGVEIPIYRLNESRAAYELTKLRIVFLAGEEKRLGTTGDLGFLITAVPPGSLGARAELKPGDFIPKIDDTFVHDEADLKLVDAASQQGDEVVIHYTRWYAEDAAFKDAVSRRRFAR
jgi:S1-C subfamily serine protease